jgi:hypothetical protein
MYIKEPFEMVQFLTCPLRNQLNYTPKIW